jgi:hypothetical protein
MNTVFPQHPFFSQSPAKATRILGPNDIVLGLRVEDEKGRGDGKKGDPVIVTRDLLKQGHMHVRGRTRSGKTSLMLSPLALKLMEDYELFWTDTKGIEHSEVERDAIFVFDLGGDLALFNAIRNKAKKLGRKFSYFSLNPKRSHYFDPFQSVQADELRVIRICNLLVEAMHLDYGLVYGGAYYTQRNLAGLLRVADRAVHARSAGRTTGLRDIAEYLDTHREKDEDSIRMAFMFLLRYEQLMPAANDPNVIDLARAIAERHVVYFFTPTMGEASTARQIAGLGLYTTVNAAMQLASQRPLLDRERPLPHCWVFCDEFQEIAGRAFSALLAQASKFGLSLVLANQTTTQLESKELSIADIVRDNTLAKVYFTVTGKRDIDELQTFSGEDRDILHSKMTMPMQLSLNSAREGQAEFITPVLRKDTILDTSATFGQAFAIVDDGKGHREPARIQCSHAHSFEEYRKLRNTPLRKVAHPEASIGQEHPDAPREKIWQRAREVPPTGERQQRIAELERILLAKEGAEHI